MSEKNQPKLNKFGLKLFILPLNYLILLKIDLKITYVLYYFKQFILTVWLSFLSKTKVILKKNKHVCNKIPPYLHKYFH